MRTGVVTSALAHAALLSWGLWSLAPKPLDASYAEALPVEIVLSDAFEGVKGEKQAPVTEKPAPTPTSRPQTLPMEAKNVGDNEVDLDTPPVPNQKPTKEAAKPQPKAAETPPPPEPKPAPKVAEPPPPQPEAKPEPETAAEPPPKEDPLAEAIEAAEKEPAPEPTPPKKVPTPAKKPAPPKPEVAEAETPPKPEPKKTDPKAKEKPKKTEVADAASDAPSEFNADDIAALLDKRKAAGGGAKRSTDVASLGSKVTTGTKLSRSQLGELDGLIKEKMRDCWNPPAGIESGEGLRVSIRIRFNEAGDVDGVPEITAGGGSGAQRIAAEAAVRAIRRCAPFNLPSEMYAGGWEVTNLNFDPSEMF